MSDHLGKETVRLFKGERSIPDQPFQDPQGTGHRQTGSKGEAAGIEIICQNETVARFGGGDAGRFSRIDFSDQRL